jgi:hypothetical protein
MDVPVTEHSYEDVRLAGVAAQLHLPVNDAMIEIGKAKSFLGEGVTLKTIEKHLNAFASMDVNKTGQVTFEQFAEAFDLKKEDGDYTAGSRALFDVIDHNGDGTIHFKDYLFGLALVNETPANRQVSRATRAHVSGASARERSECTCSKRAHVREASARERSECTCAKRVHVSEASTRERSEHTSAKRAHVSEASAREGASSGASASAGEGDSSGASTSEASAGEGG